MKLNLHLPGFSLQANFHKQIAFIYFLAFYIYIICIFEDLFVIFVVSVLTLKFQTKDISEK